VIVALKAREAIGLKLAQDVTCVDREFKGAVKRRGEVVREDDVELLERCGHSVVYVYVGDERVEGFIHEDEAVDMLAKLISGPNLLVEHVEESKAYIRAAKTGLLVVNSEGLKRVNASGFYIVATRRTGSFLRERELAGVVELIPYMISEQAYRDLVESIRTHIPILTLHPARRLKIGIVVTGTEVVTGKVRDLASPVVVEKIKEYGCEPGEILYARDDELEIAGKILSMLEGHDAVIVTGGMSVDPTDYTPHAIRRVADEVVIYGLPIKPTTMTMLAYRGEKAIIGISAGVIYYNDENALDILLPWVAAGVKPPRDYLISLGEGGLLSSFLKKVKG
jgi:molybdenum cofactor synthesis domain-containing protein